MNKPSFSQIVAAMDVGDAVSKVKQIPRTTGVADLVNTTNEMKLRLRNAVAPAIAKAQSLHKRSTFSVEAGHFMSSNSTMYVIVVITRLT